MNMSSFNLKNGYKTPQQWQELAFQKASEDKLLFIVVGGMLASGVGGIFFGAATGIIGASWTAFETIRSIKKAGRNQTAIVEFGNVAHMLSEEEFRIYAHQVIEEQGIDALHEELQFAVTNNLPINNAVLDYIEDEAPQLLMPSNKLIQQPVETTSLNFDKPVPDLISVLAKDLGRYIFYGPPGAGKDFFGSLVNEAIRQEHGDKVKIFCMECKNDPKESGYFEGKVDVISRKCVKNMEPIDVYDWCKEFLNIYDAYDANTGYKILEITEFAAINSKLKVCPTKKGETPALSWWVSKIEGYATGGDSYGEKLIFYSQNGHNDGVKIGGGTKAIFKPFVIARDICMAEVELILQAKIIPSDKKLSSAQMLRLCEASPVGRAIYHGRLNEWFPMPEYSNNSGFNRDKREFIDPTAETTKPDALSEEERRQLSEREARHVESSVWQTSRQNEQTKLVISKLETSNKTLDDFIKEDLEISEPEMFASIKKAIIESLRKAGRKDLLKKFDLGTIP